MVSIDELVGKQRAEFNRAAHLFHARFALQLAMTVAGIVSTAVSDDVALYIFAGATLALALLSLLVDHWYQGVRATAERARRATLVMGGLGKKISSAELNDIFENLSASEKRAAAEIEGDYYASAEGPGPKRLAEMLEEAAFWTLKLQAVSAKWALALFFGTIILSVISFFLILPSVGTNDLMVAARVMCAVFIFVLGTEFLGIARSYQDNVSVLTRLMLRLDAAKLRGYPETDLMMMFGDYNVSVEKAPLTLPFVYDAMKAHLNAAWQRRKQSDT